jgi:phosphoglycolate phosphatase
MSYKAIIFDLDGTLLNTLADLGNAVNRVLAQRGFPTHALDEYRYFVGNGTRMLIIRALPEKKRDDETVAECLEAFREDYGQHWKVKTRLYDGVPEMLTALTARGLRIAVVSNKPDDFTKQCVAYFLPHWRFDAVIGQRDEVPQKPDPAGALEAAELLHISPGDFLYLGDSSVDMKTAVAAGMFPVGALWGFRSAKELRENGAQALITRPLELLDLL